MRILRRWAILLVGGLVLALGLVLMPIPGPGGLPVTLAGLAILSSELPWARRFLGRVQQRVEASRSGFKGPGNGWKRLGIVAGLLALWFAGGMVAWWVLA